jgi:hypothetical protein
MLLICPAHVLRMLLKIEGHHRNQIDLSILELLHAPRSRLRMSSEGTPEFVSPKQRSNVLREHSQASQAEEGILSSGQPPSYKRKR